MTKPLLRLKTVAMTEAEQIFLEHLVLTRDREAAYFAAWPERDQSPKERTPAIRAIMQQPEFKRAWTKAQQERAEAQGFTIQHAIQLYLDIFFADPNELVALKVGCCRYCHGLGGQYQWREREYLEETRKSAERPRQGPPDIAGGFGYDATRAPSPECQECHGEGIPREVVRDTEHLSEEGRLLYGGVKRTNSGLQVIVADRMAALDRACKLAGFSKDTIALESAGILAAPMNVLNLRGVDPEAAAKAYQDLVKGLAPSK